MQKLFVIGAGVWALAALRTAEDGADGPPIALSPLFAAFAIEAGIALLRRNRSRLIVARRAPGHRR